MAHQHGGNKTAKGQHTVSGTDWAEIRESFPGLRRRINDKPLIYLDSANTAQKFESAILASDRYMREYTANVFRSVHTLSEEATSAFEEARDQLATLINAPERAELILTRGTTESLNLLAYSLGQLKISKGDRIVLTELEHHANIVPWQMLCERVGAEIQVIPINVQGELDLDAAKTLLDDARVKILSFTHVSNALGTITPVQALCEMARARGIISIVDGSQAAPHMPIDVQALGCDFYAATGHKMYAPTATGFLWGRRTLLEAMPPFMGGGEMIERVSFSGTRFNVLPNKFEAGTPNISGFIGLSAAVQSMRSIGLTQIQAREAELGRYAYEKLGEVEGLRLFGPTHRAPVFSFALEGAHAHDLAMLLDQEGIAIRSGQHCAHPLMQRLGVSATARASLAFYNTFDEIDALIIGIKKARAMLC